MDIYVFFLFVYIDLIDNDDYDDGLIDNENNDEENFQIQTTENDKKYVLVNTRIDYQYRCDNLNKMCLFDFVSKLYKKKMNAADLKYLSKVAEPMEEETSQRGRPAHPRFLFQKQHPQTTTHLLMKFSENHVPILYGPQIPRSDRDDTRERYCRALLTLFVPWCTIADLCDANQTWEEAFQSRKNLISARSWNIIENIQLLHECKKDRDEHLLQVIAEAQTDNDAIDPVFVPSNQHAFDEDEMDDNEHFLELLGNLDEFTNAAINATRKTTEDKYIEETIQAVENVGRFSNVHCKCFFTINTNLYSKHICFYFFAAHRQSSLNEIIEYSNQQLVSFISATPNLIRMNKKWQEQLKAEKERVRRGLITGNYDKEDDTLNLYAAKNAVVTVMNQNNCNLDNSENYGSILPVVTVTTNLPTQKSIADEFTLNREQRAAFIIITNHLDGDSRCRTGTLQSNPSKFEILSIF